MYYLFIILCNFGVLSSWFTTLITRKSEQIYLIGVYVSATLLVDYLDVAVSGQRYTTSICYNPMHEVLLISHQCVNGHHTCMVLGLLIIFSNSLQKNYKIIILLIYHDFLYQGGVFVLSQIRHVLLTLTQHSPLCQ